MKKQINNGSKMDSRKWRLVKQTSRSLYYVSREGVCMMKNVKTGETVQTLGRYNEAIGYRQFAGTYVHRLVAKAFIGEPADKSLQVDHIDGDRLNNNAKNLRWVTRKENNSTELSRERKRKAWRDHINVGCMVLATKGDQRIVTKTAAEMARTLGCSRVLVSNAMNKRGSAKLAKGWKIEPIAEPGKSKNQMEDLKSQFAEFAEEYKSEMAKLSDAIREFTEDLRRQTAELEKKWNG